MNRIQIGGYTRITKKEAARRRAGYSYIGG